MTTLSPFARRAGGALLAAVVCLGAAAARPVVAQQPTFREAVDVIEFDVRVVTGTGVPVTGLGMDKFDVTIDGGRRRVMSADLVEYGRKNVATTPASSAPPVVWPDPRNLRLSMPTNRTFVLVIDVSTFDVSTATGVAQTARSFVQQLRPDDEIGLYVFPTGSQISPTTDRGKILTALSRINGQPATIPTQLFNLSPRELVVLSPVTEQHGASPEVKPDGQPVAEIDRLIIQRCPEKSAGGTPIDTDCYEKLQGEVHGLVMAYEQQATQSLGMLRTLVQNLADVQGRKTLVLVSGGIVTADRPGLRPDIGSLDVLIGQEAVRTNTAIYTLYVDWRYSQQNSAEQRHARSAFTSLAEESNMLARPLEQFAGASGGAFFKALSGSGEQAFARILNETSAYYVLGVQPDAKDRDGKPHQLNVKVRQPGVTVRGSRWVTVAKR